MAPGGGGGGGGVCCDGGGVCGGGAGVSRGESDGGEGGGATFDQRGCNILNSVNKKKLTPVYGPTVRKSRITNRTLQ